MIWSLVPEIIRSDQKGNTKMETRLPLSSMQDLIATCRFHLIKVKYLHGLQDLGNLGHSAVAGTSRIYRMGRFYENSLQI